MELHGSGTAWNTQEYGSHAGTLRECHICRTQFRIHDNPRNTQCSNVNAAAIDCMLSLLLQQDTIYGRVKDEGGSLGRRVENSPFLNAHACSVSIYKDSIKAFLSLSTGCCFRAKNASVLYPSANDSAPIFSSTPVG